MAMAQVCPGCGCVLTRVRAVFDGAYRLPVVVCPGCARAVVRRRHPIAAAARLWWRRAWAGYGLAWRGVLTLALAAGLTILSIRIGDELAGAGLGVVEFGAQAVGIAGRDDRWGRLSDSGGMVVAVMGCCWAVLAGAVVTGGLAHVRRRWVPWVLFALLVLAMVWLSAAAGAWAMLERGDGWPRGLREVRDGREALAAMRALAGLAPVMLLGVPLGLAMRRAILRRDVRRFTRKRAYVRRRGRMS